MLFHEGGGGEKNKFYSLEKINKPSSPQENVSGPLGENDFLMTALSASGELCGSWQPPPISTPFLMEWKKGKKTRGQCRNTHFLFCWQPLSYSSIFFLPPFPLCQSRNSRVKNQREGKRGVVVCQYWPYPPPPFFWNDWHWFQESASLERELEMPSSQFPRLLKLAGKHDFVFPTFTKTCAIYFSLPLFFFPRGWIISWALPPKTYRQNSRSHAHEVFR